MPPEFSINFNHTEPWMLPVIQKKTTEKPVMKFIASALLLATLNIFLVRCNESKKSTSKAADSATTTDTTSLTNISWKLIELIGKQVPPITRMQ
jgi:hypothetical protein